MILINNARKLLFIQLRLIMDINIDGLLDLLFYRYETYHPQEDGIVYVHEVVLHTGEEYSAAKVDFQELTVTCITEKVFDLTLSLTPDA